jgi:hypothetical protein
VVGGYVSQHVTLRISKGLRAVVLVATISQRVYINTRVISIGIIDEDTIMDHADFECLSWKEILSLIDDYYKVNSFLVEAMYYVVFRYLIYQDIASGRRGRTAIERQVEIKSG